MKPHCLVPSVARSLSPSHCVVVCSPTQEPGTIESVAIVTALTPAHRLAVGTCIGQLVVGNDSDVEAVAVAVAVVVVVNCTVP
jgi:hypothetical protein